MEVEYTLIFLCEMGKIWITASQDGVNLNNNNKDNLQ